jgi:predicted RNA binding protein YcfA (HicA-like mRNA interferase family)
VLAKNNTDKLSPDLKHKQVIKAFQKTGWLLLEGGCHARLKKEGFLPLTIPRHDPVKKQLLKTQIKQAGLTIAEFNQLL